jgi:hypothetical protein
MSARDVELGVWSGELHSVPGRSCGGGGRLDDMQPVRLRHIRQCQLGVRVHAMRRGLQSAEHRAEHVQRLRSGQIFPVERTEELRLLRARGCLELGCLDVLSLQCRRIFRAGRVHLHGVPVGPIWRSPGPQRVQCLPKRVVSELYWADGLRVLHRGQRWSCQRHVFLRAL